VDVFNSLRKKWAERRQEKARDVFEQAAAESDPGVQPDDRRARDLPDALGEFNEMDRMGPVIGGTGANAGP
jgi:hypothetical protein